MRTIYEGEIISIQYSEYATQTYGSVKNPSLINKVLEQVFDTFKLIEKIGGSMLFNQLSNYLIPYIEEVLRYTLSHEFKLGYTLYIQVTKVDGIDIPHHVAEIKCYADYCLRHNNQITYLHLTSPIYHYEDKPVFNGDIGLGHRVTIKSGGSFQKKVKRHAYRYKGGYPMCDIKQPLLTDCWEETINLELEPLCLEGVAV